MTTERKALSGFGESVNTLEIQRISPSRLAESWARQKARREADANRDVWAHDGLGAPLSIRDVARMIGCSPWTIRQRHIPTGLPYFRAGSNGKLVFFREQVIAWILQQQKKGG
jgi:hypothetical protein